jgi:hypothetical protein
MRFEYERARLTCVLMTMLALGLGCDTRELKAIDPAVSQSFEIDVSGSTGDVDLLFVIDDSGSMRDEQESLRREIPQLVRGLTSPPLGDDGQPLWNAAESLQIAIVTTNLGTNGVPEDPSRVGSACSANANLGDDGALLACPGGSISQWTPGDDVDAFVDGIGRCADVGTDGCGLEQPLLAGVKALETAGFPREGALLGVVVLSDEEDCSLADPATFFSGDEVGPQINQRCYTDGASLVPSAEIVRRLREGRDPERFVFAALVGMPEDLTGEGLATILADSRMDYVLSVDNDLGVEPACTRFDGSGALVGEAAPGRRYIEVAQQVDGLVASICAESYQPAIAELTARIGGRVQGICTARNLTPAEDGSVRCSVRETLPRGLTCDDLTARTYLMTDDEGREICTVAQAPGGSGEGWFYDTSDDECEKVSYTAGIAPPTEVGVTLSCLSRVEDSTGGTSP